MASKWTQKTPFFNPNNTQFKKVRRIILSDPDGIFLVVWLHLYKVDNLLVAIESKTNYTIIKGTPVPAWERDSYTKQELKDIEMDFRLLDPELDIITNQPVHLSCYSDAEQYFSDWEHEYCQCDGGYTTYSSRGVLRAKLKTSHPL
ncbi:hypothetical protein BCU98_00550 [Vibrio splendidus]|nr:hypothetical protein BCU98_00550 [Vibrio splendidus]